MKKFMLFLFIITAATAMNTLLAQRGGRYSNTRTTTTTTVNGQHYTGNSYRGQVTTTRRGNQGRYNYNRGGTRGYGHAGHVCGVGCRSGCGHSIRTINRVSSCGTFTWRISQSRVWIPGYWAGNGCNTYWVDGYWSWQETSRSRVYAGTCYNGW